MTNSEIKSEEQIIASLQEAALKLKTQVSLGELHATAKRLFPYRENPAFQTMLLSIPENYCRFPTGLELEDRIVRLGAPTEQEFIEIPFDD